VAISPPKPFFAPRARPEPFFNPISLQMASSKCGWESEHDVYYTS